MGVTALMLGAAAALCSSAGFPCCQASCRWVGNTAAEVLHKCNSHYCLEQPSAPKSTKIWLGAGSLHTLVSCAEFTHSNNKNFMLGGASCRALH